MRILAQELRDAVLQAAIQGRLTTQNISSLTENNIKRHENFSQNMPFSIPQSWQWKKFSDLCIKISTGPFGTMLHKIDYETSGIPLINPIHMIRGNIVPSDNARVSRKKYKELSRYVLHSGDIVIARRGELGRTAIVTSKENGWLCGTGSFFVTPKNDVDNRYLRLFFLVPYVRVALLGNSIGTTMNNLNQSLLKSLPIPFPPLEEQRRIVERVNAIMAQIDEYEKIEQELVQLKANFPGDMRAAILQAAMQGKLTEQLESDSSVEDLLDKIRDDRQNLVDKGIIKNEKFTTLKAFDYVFDIPNNWRLINCGEVFNIKSSHRIHQSDWQPTGIPFLRGRELVQLAKNGKLNTEIFISEELYQKIKKQHGVPSSNDILISAVGTIGKVYIVKGEKNFYYKDAYILCFENFGDLNPYFVKYALESPILQKQIFADSMATTVAQLTIIKAKNLIIPLPPIEEQQRIVERLDELLPLCENLQT